MKYRLDRAGRAAIAIVFQQDLQLFVPFARKDAKLEQAQIKASFNVPEFWK
jgi:hypothetical protein